MQHSENIVGFVWELVGLAAVIRHLDELGGSDPGDRDAYRNEGSAYYLE